MYTIRTLLAHPVAAKAAYPHFYLSGISLAKARTQKKGAGAAPHSRSCEPRYGSCPYAQVHPYNEVGAKHGVQTKFIPEETYLLR